MEYSEEQKFELEKLKKEQEFEIEKINTENDSRYLEYLREIRHKQELLFDRYLFLLATGALSASVYVKYFDGSPEYLYFLILSWIFLALSLIVSLVSFIVSIGLFEKTESNEVNNIETTPSNSIISVFRYSSFILFIIGIIFLLLFYSLNFINMSENKSQNQTGGIGSNKSCGPSPKKSIQIKPIVEGIKRNSCGPAPKPVSNIKPSVKN